MLSRHKLPELGCFFYTTPRWSGSWEIEPSPLVPQTRMRSFTLLPDETFWYDTVWCGFAVLPRVGWLFRPVL